MSTAQSAAVPSSSTEAELSPTKKESATSPHKGFSPAARKATAITFAIVLIVAAIAEAIGSFTIPLGGQISVTLLPMLWGLIACTIISAQRVKPMGKTIEKAANSFMEVAVLVLLIRLAVTMGPSVAMLWQSGPALLLQEVGHLLGTLCLALPLALLLRMGAPTVGATFSIDRETAFAMVGDRYGTNSPQYTGVLTMYIFGTLFGTIIVGLIASVTESLHIFDPLALAMGSGVGSNSMMAAATAAVTQAHPAMQQQVLAVAATSNIITGMLGVYVGTFISLPVAEKIYNHFTGSDLHPISDEQRAQLAVSEDASDKEKSDVHVPAAVALSVLAVVGILISWVATKSITWKTVAGYAVILAIIFAAMGLSKLFRGKLGPMPITITLGVLLTCPISPVAGAIVDWTNNTDFVSVCTLILTVAGLTIGSKLGLLKGLGWKIIPVGTVSVAASCLLSVCVAEFALGLWS
ncbi:MAG: DUF3100 domain-containing protein [Bifidobacteriaceae bacterium]|jgi:hypothetical protein|nr:DUF3100 domain-containing protein [Bifidobacteriaceae bacterium]